MLVEVRWLQQLASIPQVGVAWVFEGGEGVIARATWLLDCTNNRWRQLQQQQQQQLPDTATGYGGVKVKSHVCDNWVENQPHCYKRVGLSTSTFSLTDEC